MIENNYKFKQALNNIDSPTRTAILYLEDLIKESKTIQPKPITKKTSVDLTPITSSISQMKESISILNSKISSYINESKKPYKDIEKELDTKIFEINNDITELETTVSDMSTEVERMAKSMQSEYIKIINHLSSMSGSKLHDPLTEFNRKENRTLFTMKAKQNV